jgi:hypothetical protein
MLKKYNKRHYLVALMLFVFITAVIAYPLISTPRTVTSHGGEEYLVAYFISWVSYIVPKNVTRLLDVPFMYPTEKALAFSDYFISQGIMGIPLMRVIGHPLASYNFLVLAALILNPLSFYILAYALTKNAYASLASAVIFGFCVGRIDTLGHLQVFSMYWTLFSLWSLVKFLETNKLLFSLLLALMFVVQGLDTVFMTFVLTASSIILFLSFRFGRKQGNISLAKLMAPLLLAGLTLIVVYYPYLQVVRKYQYTRSIDDAFGGSAYWADYLYPTQGSRLRPLAEMILDKQPWPAYMGLAISILAVLSLLYFWRKAKNWQTITAIWIFISGLILSFGPFFQIVRHQHLFGIKLPLPYWFLYHVVPGFQGLRVPQRWSQLAILGACLLITLYFSSLFNYLNLKKYRILLVSLVMSLVIVELRLPIFSKPAPEHNAIYGVLEKATAGKVLELPASTYPYPLTHLEIDRLYHHAFMHDSEHLYVNGYSGFADPDWSEKIRALQKDPDMFRTALKEFDPDYVLMQPAQWDEMSQRIGSTFYAQELIEIIENSSYSLLYKHSDTLLFHTSMSQGD